MDADGHPYYRPRAEGIVFYGIRAVVEASARGIKTAMSLSMKMFFTPSKQMLAFPKKNPFVMCFHIIFYTFTLQT